MTPDHQALVRDLLTRRITGDELLRRWPAADGRRLGIDLFRDAVVRRDSDDLERATVVSFTFGLCDEHLDLFLAIVDEEWHTRHEDVVTGLGRFADSRAIPALVRMTTWVPGYLEFDEHRALAVKAIWAIGRIPGPEAEAALRQIADDPDEIVSDNARGQLARREAAGATGAR